MTDNPQSLVSRITNAGAIYVGTYTPVAAADYFLGVNHVLPTGRMAKFGSVLTTEDFMKPISYTRTCKDEFEDNWQLGATLASLEDMPAHKKSLEVRNGQQKD